MRDAEQREMAALEKADLERRRLMTDEQRISEDKRLGGLKIFICLFIVNCVASQFHGFTVLFPFLFRYDIDGYGMEY